MRRVSGYNLDEFVDGAGYTGPIGGRNLDGHRVVEPVNLIVGSEGTLACVLEAKLRLTPLPAATALAIVHFDDEIASLRHVPEILTHQPSTVELLDELVIRESLSNAATRQQATFFEGQPKSVLIVEMFGDDAADAQTADPRHGRRLEEQTDRLRLAHPRRQAGPGQRVGRAQSRTGPDQQRAGPGQRPGVYRRCVRAGRSAGGIRRTPAGRLPRVRRPDNDVRPRQRRSNSFPAAAGPAPAGTSPEDGCDRQPGLRAGLPVRRLVCRRARRRAGARRVRPTLLRAAVVPRRSGRSRGCSIRAT